MSPKRVARRLADALVSGPWRAEDLVGRGRAAVGRRRWLAPLVGRLLAEFAGGRPTSARVAAFVRDDPAFARAVERRWFLIVPGRSAELAPRMWAAPGAPSSWAVPQVATTVELAELLGVRVAELEWLADRQRRERRAAADAPRRYSYRWVAKRSGSHRLVEVPCPRLRTVQRRMLRAILDHVPPHEAAHGFRPGRSTLTYAGPHVGRLAVLKLDLADFFATISSARVTALFLACGYPEAVARLLAGLATNSAPSSSWDGPGAPPKVEATIRQRAVLRRAHLPQGAPTSPALANLCAHRLDARLAGLAAASGAVYTRYADDLAFSGDEAFARSVERFAIHACAVAMEEGFAVNARKTRIMRRGVRQRVAGVVVNERPNVTRSEYETLKAILHNCATKGPAGQDRVGRVDFRAHLLGRIAHVASIHAGRGRRLRAVFDRIAW